MRAAASLFAFLVAALWASADENTDIYLKEGKLRAPLVVRDVQGGFAGFTGKETKIDEDGKYLVMEQVGKKSTIKLKGKLTTEKLAALAVELARYDMVTLKDYNRGSVNPRLIVFHFGRIQVTGVLQAGQDVRPNSGANATLPERYAGIVQAVHDVLTRR